MGGWRDIEGRTRAERQRQQRGLARASLFATIKQRPMSLLRPALATIFILVVVAAIALR